MPRSQPQHYRREKSPKLNHLEVLWRDRQPFLGFRGYNLRPRLRPGWRRSRTNGVTYDPRIEEERAVTRSDVPFDCIDATRISDGKLVYIKRLVRHGLAMSPNLRSATIEFYLGQLASHPLNHSVPILDMFEDPHDPAAFYVVTPHLLPVDLKHHFKYIGEILDFGEQILAGLVFDHYHGVAHLDCTRRSVMMNASTLYPQGYHPIDPTMTPDFRAHTKRRSCLSAGVRYHLVCTHHTLHIPHTTGPTPLVEGHCCTDCPPEVCRREPAYDPFKADVYNTGQIFRLLFQQHYCNLEFLEPFIDSMTRQNPAERPTARQVLQEWRAMRCTFSAFERHWRLRRRRSNDFNEAESRCHRFFKDCVHFTQVLRHLAKWMAGKRYRGSR
ncbi:hypothetical protein BV25DRAFT_1803963 [Artomyces pyxidatus]|uniref:Uncharacterized protein n=1 Tax=Artomyces pyxidatus TaxID=48021 RepID=A0ACB8T209_9AGAM|nr:hypothetical protein BV25DRAFT_1803963 [Artomyces pyxidatus]